jgi:hypothetical protein
MVGDHMGIPRTVVLLFAPANADEWKSWVTVMDVLRKCTHNICYKWRRVIWFILMSNGQIYLQACGILHAAYFLIYMPFTSYGHRTVNARLPVRSALVKHCIARLVLWWVTTWESLVL